jgi:hypothetical protein
MGRQDPSLIRTRPRPVSGAGAAAPAAPRPPLERVLQVSRAAPGLDAGAVHAIIRHAHAGNAPAAVTGALVLVDGWFVQLLEGPPASLDACLARIGRDPRHAALELRGRERALARIFAGQPMALRTRACLDAGLLDAFGYRRGFPVADFPADVLLEFVAQGCRGRRPLLHGPGLTAS